MFEFIQIIVVFLNGTFVVNLHKFLPKAQIGNLCDYFASRIENKRTSMRNNRNGEY